MNKPTTIDEYIDQAPVEARDKLRQLRALIKSLVPDAREELKWGMPAFVYARILVTFAGFKHHVGFYPTPSIIEQFSEKLLSYTHAKGSVQFPLDQELPVELIKQMVLQRAKEEKESDARWKPNK